MLVKDEDALKRLNSPLNLINRLQSFNKSDRRKNAMSLFCGNGSNNSELEIHKPRPEPILESKPALIFPEEQTSELDKIIENHDAQIKLGLVHNKTLELLDQSVDLLSANLPNLRTDKLPSVIAATSKVVESIRKERNEAAKLSKGRDVHYHFYTPHQNSISDYKIIDVEGQTNVIQHT